MEKIYFDDTTYIWKTKLNLLSDKPLILKEAYSVVHSHPERREFDAFPYLNKWNQSLDFIGDFKVETKLDEIAQIGIRECKKLYEARNIRYNKINSGSWINIIQSINPVQPQFKNGKLDSVDIYHTHTEIQEQRGKFFPHYTYVYYIQMPDIMNGEDGVLYFKGKDGTKYWIRPEEDDLIIMEGDVPHAPNNAPNSTLDRIVMAGNVGFDFIKNQKSLT
jgi:cupin superfamily acireductone dioxygenase involved in methionine salvage